MLRSPLLLGHRGARFVPGVAENTFAAFDLALSSGCDGFEFDVRLTADGVAVVAHDPRMNKIEIAHTPAADISAVPRLDAVLEKYGERAFLDVELKAPGSATAAVAAIHKHLPRQCVVSSFFPDVLREVRALDDSIALGFICADSRMLPQWRNLPCDYVTLHQRVMLTDLVDEIHMSDRRAFVWAVNTPQLMHKFAQSGVDGIISDDPACLSQTLR